MPTDATPATLGQRVAWLMEMRGQSTREVAKATGLSPATVWRIANRNAVALWPAIAAIADHFDVSLDWLAGRRKP